MSVQIRRKRAILPISPCFNAFLLVFFTDNKKKSFNKSYKVKLLLKLTSKELLKVAKLFILLL